MRVTPCWYQCNLVGRSDFRDGQRTGRRRPRYSNSRALNAALLKHCVSHHLVGLTTSAELHAAISPHYRSEARRRESFRNCMLDSVPELHMVKYAPLPRPKSYSASSLAFGFFECGITIPWLSSPVPSMVLHASDSGSGRGQIVPLCFPESQRPTFRYFR